MFEKSDKGAELFHRVWCKAAELFTVVDIIGYGDNTFREVKNAGFVYLHHRVTSCSNRRRTDAEGIAVTSV